MELLDDIPVALSAESIANRLHLDPAGSYMEDIQELVEKVEAVARPKAIYDLCYIDSKNEDGVEIAGAKFASRILRVNLDEVERVFPYIATCGTEVEDIELPSDDLMGKFALDITKQMVLGAAIGHLRKQIDKNHMPGKMSSMNPGSLEDWPISEQKPLFSIFGDVKALIGVELTDTFLMLPLKSVSGMHFATEHSFQNCQLCPRERCSGRRAPYDEKLKEKYFSESK